MAGCFRHRTGAHERGAAAVEFALVLPLFFLLVFGVVDFGYMINRDTLVNNAAREGAREGAVNPTLDAIECKVRRSLATVETPGAGANCRPSGPKVTLLITCRKPGDVTPCAFDTDPLVTGATSGGTVIVTVSYTHLWITPVGGMIRSGGMPLSKTSEMRIE